MSRSPSTDRATLRIFWQTGLQSRRLLMVAALHPIGAVCFSTLVPLYVSKILANLTLAHGHPWHYLPYFIASAVIGLLCNRFGFMAMLGWQAVTMNRLQSLALDGLLKRSVGFHNNNVGGKLVSDALDYPMAFGQLMTSTFVSLLPLGIVLVAGTALVFSESWVMGLLIAVMTIYAIGSGVLESRRRSGLRQKRLAATKEVTGHLADTVVNIQTVKMFAREQDELTHNNALGDTLLGLRWRDWRGSAMKGNNRMATLLLLQILFVAAVVHEVQHNPSLLGIGIFAFSFTITLTIRLFDVNTMLRTVEDGFLQAMPMTEILLEEPEILDMPDAPDLHVKKGAIELRDVHFRYYDNDTPQAVFDSLSLDIKPGEKVGLVGPSGGGKSTLTRLLLRFEDIESGEICIDGQNIATHTQASVRQAISYVPQEPLLFHRTVAENIAYGRPSAAQADIKKATRAAHADGFIAQLPDGYKTVVGERGVKLSGGQRQRIAIARAILKDAPILILDEATSALDSESEVLIQDALWKLMQSRTALVIAHRLSTIQKMDRIIVLDGGKIAEQGTHAELLKRKGLYAKLWAHQSGGFIED